MDEEKKIKMKIIFVDIVTWAIILMVIFMSFFSITGGRTEFGAVNDVEDGVVSIITSSAFNAEKLKRKSMSRSLAF